jgi:hypothetical protein
MAAAGEALLFACPVITMPRTPPGGGTVEGMAAVAHPAVPTEWFSVAVRLRSPATTVRPRVSRSRRSPTASAARRQRSRRTSTRTLDPAVVTAE